MLVSQYFQEVQNSYPLADILNKTRTEEISYQGTMTKIRNCEKMWIGLEYQYRHNLREQLIKHDENFGISCDFAAEPYTPENSNDILFRSVLTVYFFITYPEFAEEGFYYEGVGKYRFGGGEVKNVRTPKKSIQPLFIMAYELNNLVSAFLKDSVDI